MRAEDGRIAWERGDTNRAIDLYYEATRANPNVPDWWTSLGLAYQQAGLKNQAADAYNHATNLKKHHSSKPAATGTYAQ
jgi:Flp pilus assembly protein TadD